MDSLIINGGKKLIGDIPISGSKNACLPMMIASLMTDEKMILNNIPMLSDVKTLISILNFQFTFFDLFIILFIPSRNVLFIVCYFFFS